jgi:hypothetical protein
MDGDGVWSTEPECIQLASDDLSCDDVAVAGDAWRAEVAVNPEGRGVVVWQQSEEGRDSIWANRMGVDGRWDGARRVEPNDQVDQIKPHVAIDEEGNAIAVWEEIDGESSSIWSKRQDPSGKWVQEQAVYNREGDAFEPRVASAPGGNAIAVWQQRTRDGPLATWAARYLASSGTWNDVRPIGPAAAGNAGKPDVVMDADENAIAVWPQSGGVRKGVWANRYDDDDGWGEPTPIGPTGLGAARSSDVAVSPGGRAVAVWIQFDGERDRAWTNRSTVNGLWGQSEPLPEVSQDGVASGPEVAIDSRSEPESHAVAVWFSKSPEAFSNLISSELSQRHCLD